MGAEWTHHAAPILPTMIPLAGVAIVGHRRSSEKAVRNVALAHRFASEQFIARVEQGTASAADPHS